MNSFICETNCCRCRKSYKERLQLGRPAGHNWNYTKISIYCPDCMTAREEADREVNSQKLSSGLEAGEVCAFREGLPLTGAELAKVAFVQTEELQGRLAGAGVEITPPDWWHIHLGKVSGALVYRGFSLNKDRPALIQMIPEADPVLWTRPETELPLDSLSEILECGAVWFVVKALEGRSSKRLCNTARQRLDNPEPRIRFEALWVLIGVDLENTIPDFLRMAADSAEHPRVRGLALEGLTISLKRTARKAPWVRRALKLVEKLLLDPEPEVRWWACYVASHLSTVNSVEGHRYSYKSNLPLLEPLRQLLDDATPAGLGWSINKEAKDAIDNLEGRGGFVDHPMWHPYDPWGSV